MEKTIPRGIRNNNPLNIRIGNEWQGEVENPKDKSFEQFVSMFFGLRAGFILLRRYLVRYRLTTILDIIGRWAPASENDTLGYAKYVAAELGISLMDEIVWSNRHLMCHLVNAMVMVECGQRIDMELIERAYDAVRREYDGKF